MDYNQFNSQFNNQTVPPYPTANNMMSHRASNIIDTKDKELSFVNAVLSKLRGVEATYYFSYPDSIKWRDVEYEGVLTSIGEDFISIKESKTGNHLVLLLLYLGWVAYKEDKNNQTL